MPNGPDPGKPEQGLLADNRAALAILVLGLVVLGGAILYVTTPPDRGELPTVGESSSAGAPEVKPPESSPVPRAITERHIPNFWGGGKGVTYWWDHAPKEVTAARVDTGEESNIRPVDYAGAESCKQCHEEKYNDWLTHSHRLMNVAATRENVVGDFSGVSLDYLGGKATFFTQNGQFRMSFAKSGVRRVYSIERTIGSRFTQYYVGRMIDGPDPEDAPCRTVAHVLALGWWIDKKEWIPAVHVQGDDTDNDVWDPYEANDLTSYDLHCGSCHVTLSAGDWMLRSGGRKRITEYAPRPVSFQFSDYLAEVHPGIVEKKGNWSETPGLAILDAFESLNEIDIPEQAVELGITCEACHNGAKEHAEASTPETSTKLPSFFPTSPNVHSSGADLDALRGRNSLNANFVCSKCHVGRRPEFAHGGHTWNSTEFADAVRGACYDREKAEAHSMKALTCIHCHDPHTGIGKKWKRTPAEDSQSCMTCHEQFLDEGARAAHTHHAPGSSGGECMNCHMPKITEGLQDVVRSHRIFSPTEPRMLEANQPNACNLCHLDKSIDWTLKYLKDWYNLRESLDVGGEDLDAVYSETALASNYPDRAGPAGIGWLKSPHAPTRLAAMEALAKSESFWAMPELVEMLKDSHIMNRQLTQKNLDDLLGIRLKDKGFQFYLEPPQRSAKIEALRQELLDMAKLKAAEPSKGGQR